MGEISRSETTETRGVCLCDSDRYIDFVQLPSIEFCQSTLPLAKNVLIHSKSHPLVFPTSLPCQIRASQERVMALDFKRRESLNRGLIIQVMEELRKSKVGW